MLLARPGGCLGGGILLGLGIIAGGGRLCTFSSLLPGGGSPFSGGGFGAAGSACGLCALCGVCAGCTGVILCGRGLVRHHIARRQFRHTLGKDGLQGAVGS